MDLALYIENKRVTLFPDENINLNRAVQSLQDLTKVFTDFTREFTVPANDINNAIFKHYYDAQITNGFDARIKQDARIEIGGVTLKFGKVQLNSATLESNVPVTYSLQFFGDTVKIKDLIGDDKLSDLDLSAYNHEYKPSNVLAGLTGSLLSGNIKYPLLSYKRRFLFQDTQLDNETSVNIKYSPTFTSGVNWMDLKPAIRADKIIDAISADYGLTFTNDFFARQEWQELYMSVGNGRQDIEVFSNNAFESFTLNVYQRANLQNLFRAWMVGAINVVSGDSPYRIVFLIDNQRVFVSDFVTGNTSFSYTSELLPFGIYNFSYQVESQGVLVCETRAKLQTWLYASNGFQLIYDRLETTGNITTTAPLLPIADYISDIKVVDWLAGIVKAFNLVIVPKDDGTLYINDLSSWYGTGKILDISEYVDIETLQVSKGKVFNEIDFVYEEQESLLAEQYESVFGQQFGGLQNTIEGIGSDDKLEIKIPFENPQFERLQGSQLQYGFIVDKDLNSYNNKPFLFYAPLRTLTSDSALGFTGDTYLSRTAVCLPSHAVNFVNGFAAQFNAEFNEYNNVILSDNLYSLYYRDYINDLFSPKRREFKLNANLPISIASNLELNDRFIIKGDRYLIDNIDSNLLTGISSLTLLNDIFETLNAEDISKVARPSGVFESAGSVYYMGANVALVQTDSDWIILTSNTVNNGSNIDFTLLANKTGITRVGSINILDGLTNPIFLVQQDSTGLITMDSTIITMDSDLITI